MAAKAPAKAPAAPAKAPAAPAASAASIHPTKGFKPQEDAKAINTAIQGAGTDENAVINVICKRTNKERQEIALAFKTLYGKDLMKSLKDEFSGNIRDLLLRLMERQDEFDAKELRNTMAGWGTDEAALLEILCTRTRKELADIHLAYKRVLKHDLEKDIKGDTSGNFELLCVSLSAGARDPSHTVNQAQAKADAAGFIGNFIGKTIGCVFTSASEMHRKTPSEALHKAGTKKFGTDESTFNAIFCDNNFAQLKLVFQEYKKLTGNDIEKDVKSEFSGNIQQGLLTIVACAKNEPSYLASRLYLSMKGSGTRDRDLQRVIIHSSEINLKLVAAEYQKDYKRTLQQDISGDTSGSYQLALLTLVQGN